MEQQKRRSRQKVRVLKRYHSSHAMINTSPSQPFGQKASVGGGCSVQSGLMYQDSTESFRSYPVWKSPYCIGTKLGGLIDGSRYGKRGPTIFKNKRVTHSATGMYSTRSTSSISGQEDRMNDVSEDIEDAARRIVVITRDNADRSRTAAIRTRSTQSPYPKHFPENIITEVD